MPLKIIGSACLATLLPMVSWSAGLDARVARAAMNSDRAAVRALLQDKADVNALLADGATALHWAVRGGDIETADLLLRAGANVNAADRYGLTPLAIACSNADLAMVRRVLDAGADVNSADPNGETVLMTASRTEGGAHVVKLLLERGAAVKAREKIAAQTALMWAVRANQPESARLVLEHGAEVNARTRTGKTPERRPPNAGGGSHGKGIVRGGWPERGVQDPTPGAMTALLYAARDGRLDIARLLVAAGADINQAEANKVTPLLIAIANDHLDVANFLLDKGADVNAADYWGRTPLWTALDVRDLDYDRSGEQHSDRPAYLQMIHRLLDTGANVNARIAEVPPIRRWVLPISDISWVDFTGQTPFLRAALAGDVTVMRLLLARGADPNIPTFSNTTALMAAAGVNWSVGQTYTESKEGLMEAVRLCLEEGADLNAVNSMGFTALTGAVNRASDDIVELLVKHGARLDVKDKEGRTLQDWASGVFLARAAGAQARHHCPFAKTRRRGSRLGEGSMRRLLPLFGTMLFAAASYSQTPEEALLHQYCTGCHNEKLKTGGLVLDTLDPAHPESSAETWEKVVRKVRAGMMPPSGARRPDRASLDRFAATIAARLDNVAAARPNPGTTGLRRLNRAEYANAIRDLLSLEIDVSSLLPADDSSEGFDNIADALSVSPALLERYVSAAEKISRLAVGDPGISPSTVTYRVPTDLAQADHIEGLPLGTRGGTLIRHNFPLDAGYAIRVRARGGAIGLGAVGFQGDQIEVTLDGERIKLVDAVPSLDLQLQVRSGPHDLGVAFVKRSAIGADDLWQIYANNSGIQNVAITGPLDPSGAGDSPSRRRIFVCRPKVGQALSPANEPTLDAEEAPCARKIVATLARRAYRQPVSDTDLETLMGFYQEGRQQGGFEAGVRQALARILVGPRFVFRFESDPESLAPGMAHRITDLELASRLSFFLWSSIPDNELLDLAIKDKLHEPATLEQQARRMLADPRSESLVTNFGGQWLYLRELKNQRPESKDFNENLREAFKRETELFFESIIREDHNVLDLLNADYTFVDEQLAHHYGIANVHGSRFRRVALPENRRGLLGQGSILLVTSVANRTSPVARGKWILENLMGSPPPLPPPNVPPLKESTGQALAGSVRQRMEEHRNNAACAACHKIMDPIGFSLENYDLIGKWRTSDEGTPIEASGELVDGTRLDGPSGLRQALLSRSDVFVSTLTEKLLTYALGRGVRYYDMPALRAITRAASENDHRFSSLISGIVSSAPFQMRRAEARLSAAAEPRPTGSSPTDKP